MTNKNLGIYIHIPFCKARCAYCNFVSTADLSLRDAYIDALLEEIPNRAFEFCDYTVDTMYIGGGTPTSLQSGDLTRIINRIKDCFNLNLSEFTVECNPESFENKAEELKGIGVTRLSFGVQSTNDTTLKRIGRLHDRDTALRALETSLFVTDNVSADIMLDLPSETLADVEHTLNDLADKVKHISAYALTVEDNTPMRKSGYVTDDDLERSMYDATRETLANKSFNRYEVSNFARKGYECRHNLKYWKMDEYLGLGVAAHSYCNGIRYAETDCIEDYIDGKPRTVIERTATDAENEFIMLSLRLDEGLPFKKFKELFGIDFANGREDALKRLNKCLDISNERVKISDEYVYVGNAIIAELLKPKDV